jgi:hypothetical protein
MSSKGKVTLKSFLGEGGALLSSDSGEGNSLREVLAGLAEAQQYKVAGLRADAPTTASTQATGAGATAWRVNVAAGVAMLGDHAKDFAAQADFVVHSASELLANGQSATAALVVKDVAGTLSMVAVKGAAATTGQQLAPSDAAIQAAVGAGNDWVKVCEMTLNRTGDTAVTQSQDNTKADLGDGVTVE